MIEPLSFSHQVILENKFHQLEIDLSEYTFANLYLFRHLHHYQVITYNEEIFIKGVTRDKEAFIMPTSNLTKLSPQMLQAILTEGEMLYPISDRWLIPLEKFLKEASFKEEDSDYLFATSKLALFPGRHLSKKRNLVKQLVNQHEIKGKKLSDHLEDAQNVLNFWQKEYFGNIQETDYEACKEAIQKFNDLHLHGRIIYVDEQAAGFTIGEWISKDCYVIHFSKAKKEIKGLYQFLYQDIAQAVEGTCSWINIEQDLGIPSIRHSKHSYLPDKLLKKWRVKLLF